MKARLSVRNHRGDRVPAVLGFALLAGGAIAAAVAAGTGRVRAGGGVATLAALLVAGAGLVDDLVPTGPRGLRGHLASLARGQVTTGVVKMVVIGGAALVTVAADGRGGTLTRVCGVLVIAGATNLWNGLDVRPGRALKWFLVVSVTGLVWMPAQGPFAVGVSVAAAAALIPDLRERAMLGDMGANLLGFTAGLALYVGIPVSWMPWAAVVLVLANVLADTVSLSRIIAATPPLRWFDRIGTLPPAEEHHR